MNNRIRSGEPINLTDIDCLRSLSWKPLKLKEGKEIISPELIKKYGRIQEIWEKILDCYDTEQEILLAREGINSVKNYFDLSKGKPYFYKGNKNIRNTERIFKEILDNHYLNWE